MSVEVRPARAHDAEAIARLTTHYILHTTIHFGDVPWTTPEVLEAMRKAEESRHPWCVAVDPCDRVLGYARAGTWRTRAAYRFTVETAIYVAPHHRGRGVGRALYRWLLETLEQGGFHTAVAGVTRPNPVSERLHRACGFRCVGVFTEVGFKHDQWRDVVWFERRLGAPAPDPAAR